MTLDQSVDIVIFGSGFAALDLARGLIRDGRSILIVERGGQDITAADVELSRVPFRREPIVSGGKKFGANVPLSFNYLPRYVGLGGTAELWSGKWRTLDALDFRRQWRGRRWPIDRDELDTDFAWVRQTYQFPTWPEDTVLDEFELLAAAHGLRLVGIYEQTPPPRLLSEWHGLREAGRLGILSSARLTAATASREKLVRLNFDTPNGEVRLDARDIVIACGGIESAAVASRLLSACTPQPPQQYVGFMDHPKGIVGRLILERNCDLVEHVMRLRSTQNRLLAFALPEAELEADAIGNHTLFLRPTSSAGDWKEWDLLVNLEQFPERENRINVDPRAEVSWRISRDTWLDMERFLTRFATRAQEMLGSVALEARVELCGASHHAGALPMGTTEESVVNVHCRFHAVENLYCISSAVFPIAGSANPTMTISALAHRLARWLTKAHDIP